MVDHGYEIAAARSVEQLLTALVTEGLLAELGIAELPPLRAATCAGRIAVEWEHTSQTPCELLDTLAAALPDDIAAELHLSTRRVSDAPARAASLEQLAAAPSSLTFSEQHCTDGHAVHPFPRNRTGFSEEENRTYSPEYASTVPLHFLAIPREHTHGNGVEDTLRAEHPAVFSALARKTQTHETLIPLHPWQAARVHRFLGELRDSARVLDTTLPSRPLLSVRTLAPHATSTPRPSHLKTAVAVRLTGSVRQVSCELISSAASLSSFLTQMVQRDPEACRTLRIASEPASIGVRPDHQHAAMLGCVLRQNPETLLDDSHTAVVAAALRHAPLMEELLKTVETHAWVYQYARTVLQPLLTLFTRYGIALEAHAQNSVIVLDGSKPTAVLVRDLGGVLLSLDRLSAHELSPPAGIAQKYQRDTVDEPRALLLYSVLREQLGETLPVIAALAGISEHSLWSSVAACIRDVLRDVAACCPVCAAAAREESDHLFAPHLPLKAHLRNRLTSLTVSPRAYVYAPNPLHPFRQGERHV